jgi:cytochrome b
MAADHPATSRFVHVWDLPLRLFHWILTVLVTVSVVTGLTGGNAMIWHMRSGYAILVLVLFRITWGIVGSSNARFSAFVTGPGPVLRFARAAIARRRVFHAGHNPLGGWMVVAMIALLLVQAGTGLFANDDIFIEGPLYDLVSKRTSDELTGIHKTNIQILLALIGLHVLAVLYHWLALGDNLVTPMFSGRKRLPPGSSAAPPRLAATGFAAVLLAMSATVVWLLVTGFG